MPWRRPRQQASGVTHFGSALQSTLLWMASLAVDLSPRAASALKQNSGSWLRRSDGATAKLQSERPAPVSADDPKLSGAPSASRVLLLMCWCGGERKRRRALTEAL